MGKSNNKDNVEMSFFGHLEVLRWHLIRSIIAAFVFMVIAFLNRNLIFNEIILKPKNPDFPTNRLFKWMGEWLHTHFNMDAASIAINTQPMNIVNIDMAGQFNSHIMISLVAGLVMASPYIIWEIWRFIKPALLDKEKKYATKAVFFISFLFILGILFGYYLIAPLSIHFLNTYVVSTDVVNTIKLDSYISTITSVTFASGIIFELPIIILFLSRVGIITPMFLKKYRRHAYILLLIIAGIITPPDVFSQIMVCIPLVLLYEASVIISRRIYKRRQNDIKNDEQSFDEQSTETV